MKKDTLLDKLLSSRFAIEYIKILAPITAAHMKIFMEGDINYDDIGNEKERQLKEISSKYSALQTAVSDLDLVLKFLRIKERKSILEIYPDLENQQEYFKYHLENYVIRTVTITDILGKLGNLIFETNINEERCNGYTFKEKMKEVDETVVTILETVLQATKVIKDKRHQKIHAGKSDIDYFDGIVFYDDLAKLIGSEADIILDEFTDENIKQEIDTIETEINNILDKVIQFTDYSTDKFLEIANR